MFEQYVRPESGGLSGRGQVFMEKKKRGSWTIESLAKTDWTAGYFIYRRKSGGGPLKLPFVKFHRAHGSRTTTGLERKGEREKHVWKTR